MHSFFMSFMVPLEAWEKAKINVEMRMFGGFVLGPWLCVFCRGFCEKRVLRRGVLMVNLWWDAW
jgi:hypothetical protein